MNATEEIMKDTIESTEESNVEQIVTVITGATKASKGTLAAQMEELAEKIVTSITKPEDMYKTATGTFYVADKNEYSFDVYFIYNANEFKYTTIDHLVYNLKTHYKKLERNGKEVKFSEDNIRKSFGKMKKEEMSFLEVDGNKGFFKATECFGAEDYEREYFISRQLFNLIEKYPAAEILFKMGFTPKNFYRYSNYFNWQSFSILEFFGFQQKLSLKILRKILQLREDYNSCNYYWGDDASIASQIKRRTLNELIEIRDVIDLSIKLNKKYGMNGTGNIITYFKFAGAFDFHKYDEYISDKYRFIEYMFYECDCRQAMIYNDAARYYFDYIKASRELGGKYDKYPDSLKKAHDIAVRYYRFVESDALKTQFAEAVTPLTVFEGNISKSEFAIVAPKTIYDIVEEGTKLSHCVKSYIKSIAEGYTSIVFLRNKKDKETPLYTIEIKDNCIIQAAGWDNQPLPQEALDALKTFQKDFDLEMSI